MSDSDVSILLSDKGVVDVGLSGGDSERWDAGLVEGAPVPESITVLLFGTGLVGLVGFRKKFKK